MILLTIFSMSYLSDMDDIDMTCSDFVNIYSQNVDMF